VVRLISGVLLAAAFIAIVWFSNAIVLLVVASGVGVLAFHEYEGLMRHLGAAIPRTPALLALMAAIAVVPFPVVPVEVVVSLGVVITAIGAMMQFARQHPLTAAAAAGPSAAGSRTDLREAVFGAVAGAFALAYLALPLGSLVGVHVFGGRGAVLLLVFTVVISDTAQYYTGRAFGRRHLAPRLSPKKTIEGAIGGFVAAPIFLAVVGPYLVPVVTPMVIAPLGPVLVACGIAGDLFESLMKRAADMKDSSALIPGHGGILDRIDALLFATPPFYLFLRWVYAA
jgi:phosphatidate cytidylyltransferase